MSFARTVMAAGLLGLAALCSLAANAQQVYRIVGPDGRVTFTDKPPTEGKGGTAPTVSVAGGGEASTSLPFELRSVVNRYPVTLYARPDCAPCDAGRIFLIGRGIPFDEKTVISNDDVDALQRLSGAASLPFATIGGQQLRGFSEVEWGQFLDAAGYPKTSQLPSGYRRPPASPLVTATAPQESGRAPAQQRAQRAATPSPQPNAPNPSNPAGIQF